MLSSRGVRRWGGGVLPIVNYTQRLRSKGVPFFALALYESVGRFAALCKKVAGIHLKLKEVTATSKY